MVCLQMLPQTQIVGIELVSDSVTMLARQFAITGLYCVGAVQQDRRVPARTSPNAITSCFHASNRSCTAAIQSASR